MAKKNFFTSIRFFEFSKKLYFRYSKRTFKPVYLENNCSHKKFSKLRKLGFWFFFTEIVAKKLFKYFLTYKNKEINAKSFFSKFGPFRNFFFRGFRFFEVRYKIWRLNKNGLLYRKYHFLENSKYRILAKKFFLAKQKNTCLFIVDKEPKKNYLVQICDIDCQSNMEWPLSKYIIMIIIVINCLGKHVKRSFYERLYELLVPFNLEL